MFELVERLVVEVDEWSELDVFVVDDGDHEW